MWLGVFYESRKNGITIKLEPVRLRAEHFVLMVKAKKTSIKSNCKIPNHLNEFQQQLLHFICSLCVSVFELNSPPFDA